MNSHTALCKESSLYNDIDELARNVDLFHDILAVDLRRNAVFRLCKCNRVILLDIGCNAQSCANFAVDLHNDFNDVIFAL